MSGSTASEHGFEDHVVPDGGELCCMNFSISPASVRGEGVLRALPTVWCGPGSGGVMAVEHSPAEWPCTHAIDVAGQRDGHGPTEVTGPVHVCLSVLISPLDGERPVARSPWGSCPAVSDDDPEGDRLESTGWRNGQREFRSTDVETAVECADLQDRGGYSAGQEESAVDVQRADVGCPRPLVHLGRYSVEKHDLDGVFIHTNRGWRRSILPPQHRAPADRNSEQEGQENHGQVSPLGRNPRDQGWSRGADPQCFCRLLRSSVVGMLHLHSVCMLTLA